MINPKKEQKKYEIKRSGQMMRALYRLSVNSYKLLLLAASKLKNNLQYQDQDTEKKETFKVVISRQEIKSELPSLNDPNRIIFKLRKIVKEIENNNSIAIPEHSEKIIKYRFIPIIETIAYDIQKQEMLIEFYPSDEVKQHFNPKNTDGFDLDEIKHLNFITSMKQVAIYNICHKDLRIGSTKISIAELRKLTKTEGKYKQVGHFISRVIKYQVDIINQKSNINIEFQPLKDYFGKKITHIKFNMCYKNQHPLKQLDLKNNDLTALLIEIGVRPEKIKSLSKYPINKLLKAAKYTQNQIKLNKIKVNPEACFIGSLNKIKGENIKSIEIVQSYMGLLNIEQKNQVYQEFNDNLSLTDRLAFNNNKDEENKKKKQAVNNQFNADYNKWIYDNKLNQIFEKTKGEK